MHMDRTRWGKSMKQAGALSILITMILGLLSFLSTQSFSQNAKILKLETQEIGTREMLKEIRTDVKNILQVMPRKR